MPIQYDKLLKLAAFLRRDVPSDVFDYTQIMRVGGKPPAEAFAAGGGCGTVGCAMGWTPAVFDELEWAYLSSAHYTVPQASVIYKDNPGFGRDYVVMRRFFGLNYDEVNFLFTPNAMMDIHSGDTVQNRCGGTASPVDVADHIENFVQMKRSGEW